MSGPGFGLIRKCVLGVCRIKRLLRAEALYAQDPWLEVGIKFQLRLLEQKAVQPRAGVQNHLIFSF